nr:hypothetical protein [uncultured Mediterranean phage uvMED]BAR22893.1 hypothetical protein [uncultured Mediterranean phage uvMED]
MAHAYIFFETSFTFNDMKCSTVQTFSGLASCAVDLYTSSYSDDSRITVRDTNTGDKLEIEGMTNSALQGAVISYVHALGYRKEDASAKAFLENLSTQLAKAMDKEAA